MVREISAGGVVIRYRDGAWWVAAIEPPDDESRGAKLKARGTAKRKTVLALPKGIVDPGEKPVETALREVYEETGISADLITKLADIKYVYSRIWSDGERVFKIVSFYLMRYRSGRINQISSAMRVEVARALWIPLADATRMLAYKGERQMAQKSLDYVAAHSELESVDSR
jgi:8-oxo-dGTP pyrophosphatase MutT (NUDIX family)